MTATTPNKRVTILCEKRAGEQIHQILEEVGALGYEHFEIEKDAARDSGAPEDERLARIEIELILPRDVAENLVARIENELLPRFAIIASAADVSHQPE